MINSFLHKLVVSHLVDFEGDDRTLISDSAIQNQQNVSQTVKIGSCYFNALQQASEKFSKLDS